MYHDCYYYVAKVGEDISWPLWARLLLSDLCELETISQLAGVFFIDCVAGKNMLSFLIRRCWLSEELALLKFSQVALDDDKKGYWVNYWKSSPKQTITHVLFFRTIYNLRHHHCTLLYVMWRDAHTEHTRPLWQCEQLFGTFLRQRPCPTEVWDVMHNTVRGFRVFSDQRTSYSDVV